MTGRRDFLAVDVQPGGRAAEVALGLAVVIVLVGMTFDGTLRVVLLLAGCIGAAARAVWFVGPHCLWFDGEMLVEQRNRRVRRFTLAEVTGVEVTFVLERGAVLLLRMREGKSVTVWNLDDDTAAFRHELGRRLRLMGLPTLASAGSSTLQSLGLHR